MSLTTKVWGQAIKGLKKSTTTWITKNNSYGQYSNTNTDEISKREEVKSFATAPNTNTKTYNILSHFQTPLTNIKKHPVYSLSSNLLANSTTKLPLESITKHLHSSSSANSTSGSESNENTSSKKSSSPGIISSMLGDPKAKQDVSKSPNAAEMNEEKEENKEEGQKDEKKGESPFMRSQRYAKWLLLANVAIGTPIIIYEWGPPRLDDLGNDIEDEFSQYPKPIAYTRRAIRELISKKEEVVEPYSEKLLPDPLQEPYYQPPYTLVIELFDVLLRPTYDQVSGWRFKKRPGIEYFLSQVGPPLFEIVIFTKETGMTAYPLIDSMDPKGYIMYRLFRDAARYKSGFNFGNPLKGEMPKLDPYYQKDLRYLNRDLNRVIQVDCDKRAIETQPSNGLCLKPWDGSSTDTELYDLAAFLRTVATSEVDNVQPVLEHYSKYEDPLAAFKLAHSRMQEEQEKLSKDLKENKPTLSFGTSSIAKFFTRN